MNKDNNHIPKAYLSMTESDFKLEGQEVPECLINNPGKTEGELMTDQEIADWIVDTQKTFKIIKEQDDETFKRLYQGYLLDIEYLVKAGRIDQDTADDLLNLDNFEY